VPRRLLNHDVAGVEIHGLPSSSPSHSSPSRTNA
jgi:hypothetical protein